KGDAVHVFFFNDTATTEIYTLSLHDALPISLTTPRMLWHWRPCDGRAIARRSEEHTSELQSRSELVCRLLLEKKKDDRRGAAGVGGRLEGRRPRPLVARTYRAFFF